MTDRALPTSHEAWRRENGVEPKKQRGLSEAPKAKGYRTRVAKRITVGAVTKAAREVEGLTVG